MAVMIPESPDYFRPRSNAEKDVFKLLKERLPEDYFVFYSLQWIKEELSKGYGSQGEGDFVIIHRLKGILVVEIKGGIISIKNREWHVVGEHGREVIIQDPGRQADRTKFALNEYLTKKGVGCFMCHAVWFPDCITDNIQFPIHIPKEIILDVTSMNDPLRYIENVFEFWGQIKHNDKPSPLTEPQLKNILRLLNPTFRLVPTFDRRCDNLKHKYAELTYEQKLLIDLLSEQKEVSVVGRAGTGKTMMALEKARRDIEDGLKVIFICYNRHLADYLQENGGIGNNVFTVHSFALHYLKTHYPNRVVNFGDNDDADFDYLMEEFSEVAVRNKEQYDSVIIDEAQDLEEIWIESLNYFLKPGGSWYQFYDPFQTLNSSKIKIDKPFLARGITFQLFRNMRNTDPISRACLNVIGESVDAKIHLKGISGDIPEIIICPSRDEMESTLDNVIYDLLYIRHLQEERLTILTLESLEKTCISIEKYPNLKTVRKFKGLENDVLILTDVCLAHLGDDIRQRNLYVALSRARVHVIIWIYAVKLQRRRPRCQNPQDMQDRYWKSTSMKKTLSVRI